MKQISVIMLTHNRKEMVQHMIEDICDQKQNTVDKMQVLDQMVDMVDESIEALQTGELDTWGRMLDRAWNLKKQCQIKLII